jgi:hypothetical protein
MYKSLGVHVYIIEEPPFHPDPFEHTFKYKKLLMEGKLTNNNLRNMSLSRDAHDRETKKVVTVIDKYRGERGFTYIPLNDLVCDDQFCPIGTGDQPYFADQRHMSYFGVNRVKQRVQKYVSY